MLYIANYCSVTKVHICLTCTFARHQITEHRFLGVINLPIIDTPNRFVTRTGRNDSNKMFLYLKNILKITLNTNQACLNPITPSLAQMTPYSQLTKPDLVKSSPFRLINYSPHWDELSSPFLYFNHG